MKTEVKYLGNTEGELFTSWHYVHHGPTLMLFPRKYFNVLAHIWPLPCMEDTALVVN